MESNLARRAGPALREISDRPETDAVSTGISDGPEFLFRHRIRRLMMRHSERCLALLREFGGRTDLVKVVTGMRGTGKSSLLKAYRDELVSGGVNPKDIILIDLDIHELVEPCDREALDRLLEEAVSASGTKHVFLYGMQNVNGWEASVAALVGTGRCDVYVAGSSASLASGLEGDIGFVEIRVLPPSFAEYMSDHPGDPAERLDDYLHGGSIPGIEPGMIDDLSGFLYGRFSSVVVEDVMLRLGVFDGGKLMAVVRHLFTGIGEETSVDAISSTLGISNDTVDRYVSAVTDAQLLIGAEIYDMTAKRPLRTKRVYYATEPAMIGAALRMDGTDTDLAVENMVYLELLRRGYVVHSCRYRDGVMGFMAVADGSVHHFAVSGRTASEDERMRMRRSLESIRDGSERTILTMDGFGTSDEDDIQVVNVLNWLLDVGRTDLNDAFRLRDL